MTNEEIVNLEISKIKGANKTPKPSTDFQTLFESIRDQGVQTPIAVNKDSLELLPDCGNSRVLVCNALGRMTIPAVLLPYLPGSPEARLYAIDSELVRSNLSLLEEC